MRRGIRLFAVLIGIVIFASCGSGGEISERPNDPDAEEYLKYSIIEENLREYLVGEWVSDKETLSDYTLTHSDINCNMTISEDASVSFLFYNRETNDIIGDYSGQITFDRFHKDSSVGPDLITIELTDPDWPGGDFFFKQRTIYDGKRVMSWFPAGNGNCILDLLADIDNSEYAPEEVIFEKITGEKSDLKAKKTSEFYAVYWGQGKEGQSFWLDEVVWTPTEEYNPDALYPERMTLYEDDVPESVLYKIAPENMDYILQESMYAGDVYFVETDENGDIVNIEDAAYREYIDYINGPEE